MMNYKDAGVDIEAGEAFVEAIAPLAKATARPGSCAELGGFGALFNLKAVGYDDPVLVASTDGVGTKLKLAIDMNRHDTIGIDLVAMCVNDIVTHGAEPLFFLDYYATAKLNHDVGWEVVAGIAEGCRQAGCALIGGETAEMPGLYVTGDYDLAGFAVGAVESGEEITGTGIVAGDLVLGLASNGLHANGFSLVRRVIDTLGLDLREPAPFDTERSLGGALLTPTRIYVNSCLAVMMGRGRIKAMAHITGGGLIGNLTRILPPGITVDANVSWPMPAVFSWLLNAGGISPDELFRVFNCGIGMAVVVAEEDAAETISLFTDMGETVWPVGICECE